VTPADGHRPLTSAFRAGSETSQATGSGVVEQARVTGLFEGSAEVLIGVQGSRRPFRAFALTDPGRIVIDVRGP